MKKTLDFINKNASKIILVLCIVFFIALLIPLLQISEYNQPSRDDYNFGYYLYKSHGSFGEILSSAYKGAQHTFNNWQGLFVVNFMLALVPSAIKTHYYVLTAYIGILFLVLSTWFFARQLLYKVLRFKLINYRIVLLIILIINIQLLPSAVQGFYWYPAVVTYTVPYSFMMVLFGLISSSIHSKKNLALKWISTLFVSILISGCNYITVLTSMIVLILYLLYTIFIQKKLSKLVLFSFIIMLPGFVISVLAPGNALRQVNEMNMSAIGAILISFPAAARSIFNLVFRMPFFISILALIPFIYISVKESTINLKYKYPIIVLILSFCLYASTFTPTYYAMYGTGLGRIENIRMFTLVWLIVLNLYYFFGWLKSITNKSAAYSKISKEKLDIYYSDISNKLKPLILLVIITFILGSFYVADIDDIAGISAVNSLINGEAIQYEKEHMQREELYLSDEKNIIIEPLTVHPNVLFFWDVSDGVSGDSNPSIEQYYDKDSVILK